MPLPPNWGLAASIALSACTALAGAEPAARATQGAASGAVPGAASAASQTGSPAPALADIRIDVPRPIRAATALLGLGRQRLALVIGVGKVGARTALESVTRDVQAVAAALAAGGYVVMRREDVVAAELRAALIEFRARLQPEGVGFVYFTGLGAQLDGGNLLLARDARLDAEVVPATLAQGTVRLAEVIDALQGTGDSPRLLAVDAAYAHPALARLPQAGLGEPRLPPGTMALFSQPLGTVQQAPALAPLAHPPPTNPSEVAASHFARALLAAFAQPRTSGPAALRAAQRTLSEATPGQIPPWLSGSSDEREEFAEPTILDALLPRSAEEATRSALEQLARRALVNEAPRDGAKPVAEVLQQTRDTGGAADGTPRRLPQPADTVRALGHPGTATALAAAATTTAAAVAEAAAARAATGVAAGPAAIGAAGGVAGSAGSALSMAAKAMLAGERVSDGSAAAGPVPPATGGAASAVAGSQAVLATAAAAVAVPTPAADHAPAAATAPSAAAPAQVPDLRTVRAGERGERPLYTPRTNAFGYAEGDTFSYRVVDTWKGEISGSHTHAVEEMLDDGRMLGNGRQLALDAQGRLEHLVRADGSSAQFEPYEDSWWAAPRRGEQRDVHYTERFRRADGVQGSTEWSGSASVGRARSVETPAGAFDALPITSDGWWTERIGDGPRTQGKWSRTVWYAPRLGHPVVIELQLTDARGRLLHRERVELTHAQTARSAEP